MLEAYAFLAVFTLQVLAISVLHPAWFIRYVRVRALSFPAERFAQLYPGVDRSATLERFLSLYRVLNMGIAVLGLLLLGWLFRYMRRPGWDDGPVEARVAVYFAAQMMLPLCLVAWGGVRYSKVLEHSLAEGKRKAVLQRRGLFDFVSPSLVFLAVSSYFLFAGFVISIQQNPFPGFAGYINIGGITLVYALNAFGVHTMLYGRKKGALETHTDRMRAIGLGVKALRLLVHRLRRVPVAQLHARAAGSAKVGAVRAECFSGQLRASLFHGLHRASGSARRKAGS